MKRAFVFLFLAPLSAALIAALIVIQAEKPDAEFAPLFAILIGMAAFCLTLPISALAGYVDEALRNAPVLLRALLSPAVGAIVACVLFDWTSSATYFSAFLAICGGVGMGLCSLLANDYSEYEPVIPGHAACRRLIERIICLHAAWSDSGLARSGR